MAMATGCHWAQEVTDQLSPSLFEMWPSERDKEDYNLQLLSLRWKSFGWRIFVLLGLIVLEINMLGMLMIWQMESSGKTH